MTQRTTLFSGLLVACGALALFCARLEAQGTNKETDIAVVVNPRNSVMDLKLTMLRRVVLGEETLWGNRLSVVVVLDESRAPENEKLLRVVAQMTSSQFGQHWVEKVFRGQAPAEPTILPSLGSVNEFVAKHPGAIAFVPKADVRRDLKVLKIDGRLPGDEGYVLR